MYTCQHQRARKQRQTQGEDGDDCYNGKFDVQFSGASEGSEDSYQNGIDNLQDEKIEQDMTDKLMPPHCHEIVILRCTRVCISLF